MSFLASTIQVRPQEHPLRELAHVDPADIGNKIAKYTGPVQLEFDVRELEKEGQKLQAFVIQAVSIPIIKQKPGSSLR